MVIRAPFPWFGGKSTAAAEIWSRLGACDTYIEPFAGSLAVLLNRPVGMPRPRTVIVNDIDRWIVNFWRAAVRDPDEVLWWAADVPLNESDLMARHRWLVEHRHRLERCDHDPDWFDPRMAGYWWWGISGWIGSGWCDPAVNPGSKLPSIAGMGIFSKRLRHIPDPLRYVMAHLYDAIIACGDWQRVLSGAILHDGATVGIVLDPPYAMDGARSAVYQHEATSLLTDEVLAWAADNGDRPNLRIVLCGYDTDFAAPEGWRRHTWVGWRGYADNDNRERETLWCSPHCSFTDQGDLFGPGDEEGPLPEEGAWSGVAR